MIDRARDRFKVKLCKVASCTVVIVVSADENGMDYTS